MDSGRVVRQGSGANRLLGYGVGRGLPDPALPHLLVFYWKTNFDWTFPEEDISIRVQQSVKRCAAKQNIRSTNPDLDP